MSDAILDTPAPALEPVQTPATPAPQSFADSLPEDVRNTVGAKFQTSEALARAYANLEKHLGADKNDIIRIPRDRTPEGMKELNKILGVPDTADAYEVNLPENSAFSPDDITALKGIAHQNGITPQAMQALTDWYSQAAGKVTSTHEQDTALQAQQAKQNLQKDWGLAYDTNIRLINAYINKNASTPEEASSIRDVVGSNETVLRLFQRQAEQSIPAKDLDVLLHGRPTSPEQAKLRMAEIARDPLWMDAKQLTNPIRKALVDEHANLAKVVNS